MKIVAVIPARGGSKSVPLKNIKKFCGKPLIAWSILSALKAKGIDRVIVSTDHTEIAKVAKKFGAEVPFMRPAEISGDAMGVEPVLKHAYEWLQKNEGYTADALMLLMPTTPTRQTFHIDDLINLFKKTGADSTVAVNETPANHTPYWTLVRNTEGKVTLFNGDSLKNILTRRQEFPQKCYARNDLGYVLKPQNLYEDKPNLYGEKVELYCIPNPSEYEADINNEDDWHDAELKVNRLLRHSLKNTPSKKKKSRK
jgi:CMP-N,N'-diacetyllegionaminic acid synthase